jgi:hypothetical protein
VPPAAATLPPLPSRQEPVAVIVPPKAPGYANRASAAARASGVPSIFDNVAYRRVVREAPRLPMPTTKTCQWPMNDGAPVWLFCELPARVKCYCEGHAATAYRVKDRREMVA